MLIKNKLGIVSLLTIAFVGVAFNPTPAFGALIKGTLVNPNDLTIDTGQNLAFLNPSATLGLTYNQVLSSSFVTQQGFRVATIAEFQQLATNAGIPDLSANFSTGDVAGVNNLISFLGQTIPGPITLPAPALWLRFPKDSTASQHLPILRRDSSMSRGPTTRPQPRARQGRTEPA